MTPPDPTNPTAAGSDGTREAEDIAALKAHPLVQEVRDDRDRSKGIRVILHAGAAFAGLDVARFPTAQATWDALDFARRLPNRVSGSSGYALDVARRIMEIGRQEMLGGDVQRQAKIQVEIIEAMRWAHPEVLPADAPAATRARRVDLPPLPTPAIAHAYPGFPAYSAAQMSAYAASALAHRDPPEPGKMARLPPPVAYMVDCGNTDIADGDVRFWCVQREREARGCAAQFDAPVVPLYAAPMSPDTAHLVALDGTGSGVPDALRSAYDRLKRVVDGNVGFPEFIEAEKAFVLAAYEGIGAMFAAALAAQLAPRSAVSTSTEAGSTLAPARGGRDDVDA